MEAAPGAQGSKQKASVAPRICVACNVMIALHEPGVQRAVRNGIDVGELHHQHLRLWQQQEAMRLRGGANGDGRQGGPSRRPVQMSRNRG